MLSLATLALGGCSASSAGSSPIALTASPSHASMFGEVVVTLDGDFSKLGSIESVTVDGIRALDVTATSSRLSFQIQGAPHSGPAHVVIVGKDDQAFNDTAFRYDAPAGGAPLTWAAFGASLTMGGQSGGLPPHAQLMSYPAQVARAAGVFLAPPLVVQGFAPPLEPAQFAQSCATTVDAGTIANAVIDAVTDPSTHEPDLRLGRQDASLATRNFSVGGANLAEVNSPATGEIGLLERVEELPDGVTTALFTPPLTHSQADRLVALDPDVAISADLLFNDIAPVMGPTDLVPASMTDPAKIEAELQTLAKRLGGLHGQYFIGNVPPIEVLPVARAIHDTAIASGTETEASYAAKLDEIHTKENAYNQALATVLAPYKNLHIVDVASALQMKVLTGLTVGGQHITGAKFGGIFSLDAEHLTDTGYALLANVFIDAINQAMTLKIPDVDLASVLATDALSPARLAADGVHCPPSGG